MKYTFLILTVLLGIVTSCSKHKSHKLTAKIESILDSLPHDGFLFEEINIEKYNRLLKLATNEDLTSLTNHKKPIVRCYAFDALCERNYPKIRELFYAHENDTIESVIVGGGCVRISLHVRTNMFMALHPVSSKSKYKFTRTEFNPLFKKYFTRPIVNSSLGQ